MPRARRLQRLGQCEPFPCRWRMAFVIGTSREGGLLHHDVMTVAGEGLADYMKNPFIDGDAIAWKAAFCASRDETIPRSAADPFQPDGGLRLVRDNLSHRTFKTSPVDPSRSR